MIRKLLKIIFLYIPLCFVLWSLLLVVLFKWVPVMYTPLMAVRQVQNFDDRDWHLRHRWARLDNISDAMERCAIASEDQKFFTHKGFDFEEIKKMMENHRKYGTPVRGCSTISQQTAKNCFTFCTHSWARKCFEAYYTFLIEKIWGKRRILEVYLNIAEMGPGIFGTESAASKYFGKHAAELSLSEAASIVCCLPNPIKRSPEWVGKHMSGRKSEIENLSSQIRLSYK